MSHLFVAWAPGPCEVGARHVCYSEFKKTLVQKVTSRTTFGSSKRMLTRARGPCYKIITASLGEAAILLAVWALAPVSELVSDSQPGLTPKRLILRELCSTALRAVSVLHGSESRATFSRRESEVLTNALRI